MNQPGEPGTTSLHDMFMNDFKDGSIDQDVTMTASGADHAMLAGRIRVFYNHDLRVRYAALFVSAESYTLEVAASLAHSATGLLAEALATVEIVSLHPVYDPVGESSNDFPFTGRVFLYIDTQVSPHDRDAIAAAGRQAGAWVKIRDHVYRDFMNSGSRPLAFVSHDSRDKEDLVRPLVQKLAQSICPVWYDEYSLSPGDSLRESIDRGLAETDKCLLVLSPYFLSNNGWTKGEFNAAMTKHFSAGGSVVIPIWHNVSRQEVADYSPLIADIVALPTDVGIDEMARRLARLLKP